jgi:hypothetical protein
MADLDRLSIPDEPNAITITRKSDAGKAVRAHTRLDIIPTPTRPDLVKADRFIESPWPVTAIPVIDPTLWDTAVTESVRLTELSGTDRFLKRTKVSEHIDAISKTVTPYQSYALIAELDGSMIIIDGHHRLMAAWLLGQETAPVWKVEL